MRLALNLSGDVASLVFPALCLAGLIVVLLKRRRMLHQGQQEGLIRIDVPRHGRVPRQLAALALWTFLLGSMGFGAGLHVTSIAACLVLIVGVVLLQAPYMLVAPDRLYLPADGDVRWRDIVELRWTAPELELRVRRRWAWPRRLSMTLDDATWTLLQERLPGTLYVDSLTYRPNLLRLVRRPRQAAT